MVAQIRRVKAILYVKAGGLLEQLNLHSIQQQLPEVTDPVFHN